MKLFSYDDPTWVKDFQEALRDLSGEQLLLPPPESAKPTCVVAVAPAEDPDISSLSGAALRMAILERMHVSKTANPYIREVFLEDLKVGEVARSPWQPLVWISSSDRNMPFYSMVEAKKIYFANRQAVIDEGRRRKGPGFIAWGWWEFEGVPQFGPVKQIAGPKPLTEWIKKGSCFTVFVNVGYTGYHQGIRNAWRSHEDWDKARFESDDNYLRRHKIDRETLKAIT